MRCALFSSVLSSFLLACGDAQTKESAEGPDKNQVLFSQSNPGRYADYRDDHNPQVTAQRSGSSVNVSVKMPFAVDIGHYVEFIAIAEPGLKQRDIKRFQRGERPSAKFDVPAGIAESLTVVAKCNQHGLWTKGITILLD